MTRYTERPLISLALGDFLKSDERNHLFLKQLQRIGGSAEQCDRALSHFWGFYAERVRLQDQGDILPDAWNVRNAELHARWQQIMDNANMLYAAKGPDTVAKYVYTNTLDGTYKAKLGLHDTSQPYFTLGNYHDLANRQTAACFVHWHSEFSPQNVKASQP